MEFGGEEGIFKAARGQAEGGLINLIIHSFIYDSFVRGEEGRTIEYQYQKNMAYL